ncbi:MAG: PINc/VapC family ATPase [Candidatus Woesearchaeota archaeon]|jgi:ATPase|nr:PINc/VapC family ATPase [Candidatus Woesearchaeota archaeon]
MQRIEKLIPDTSVIIEGIISEKIKNNEYDIKEIVIHEAVLAELEHQANLNKAIGFLGLDEIKRVKDLAKDFELKFEGARPNAVDIKHASLGEIDALIRQLAWESGGTLLTSDKIQARVADAKGMNVIYIEPEQAIKKIQLEGFFDDKTMSVHLRENVLPYAKKGFPGKWEFVPLRKEVLKEDEVQNISREIIEEAKLRRDSFIEIERPGSTIVQLGPYRIVITKPPFSDGWEITAVKPVRRLSIEDYELSEKLMTRVAKQAEGILIAGAPGMGKSTFAQALAEYYSTQDKVVKTVEAPRDLVLSDKVTQYAISHGDAQEIHDILLLSRPDYTIFDEMRNTSDFQLFGDMRLAGVGMVGVVHATNPIDAIQRFIGRVEMGVIPQIIDTVVFIKDGVINKVLSLKMTVKVPNGMTEADLARPVVVVNEFETGQLSYEIYSYGEQTVVIPVESGQETKPGIHKLAASPIVEEFQKYCDNPEVDVISNNKAVVKVPEDCISRIIGKQGQHINKIEEKLGISIDIQSQEGTSSSTPREKGEELPYNLELKSKFIVFDIGVENEHKDIDIYVNEEYLLTAKSGATGLIKIKKNNNIGKILLKERSKGNDILLYG